MSVARRRSFRKGEVVFHQGDPASRATVNQVLRGLEARGVVELKRGKTIVTDPAALATRAR